MIEGPIIAYCKEQITMACLALDATLQANKSLFQNKGIKVIDYFSDEEKEPMLELRFKNATLNCLFDASNLCESVFLFLDDSSDLIHYIEHCSQAYQYNSLLKGWINNGCFIQIHTESKECSLSVLPIKSVGL